MAFSTDTYIIKGMRQDDSDLLFNGNKESLAFAFENMNIRFSVDKDTTSLVATQEKGNVKCDIRVLQEFFLDVADFYNTGTYFSMSSMPFKVLGYCTVDKYLVLFGKCTADTSRILYDHDNAAPLSFNDGDDIILRLEVSNGVFYGWLLYKGQELHFDLNYPIETVGNVETNLTKKVYFVDGINVPRSVNVVNANAGLLSNINLGFSLALNDELMVTKNYSVQGNFPMGKVRFFYTYYNDLESETNIVDWSPFFDCNFINQGGSESSTYTTQFAFNVVVNNVDHQFGFIRIYFQHFTSNDASTYSLKYIERPLDMSLDSFETIVTFDGTDVKNSTITYIDHKLNNYTFIPYTLAEKNNRMFYGNIKRSVPSIQGVDFSGKANIQFYHKLIGYEDLTRNVVYQYTSNTTTFAGSNFDYMGFRKHNWYRFGLIAQYYTGEWSDVMFITDKQCDISSRTEIEYEYTHDYTSHNHVIQSITTPHKSNYYIPSAKLVPQPGFDVELQKLKQLGFRRVKPVCVVPTYECRDVLTQGISCATTYTGGQRRMLKSTSSGLFAIPSWFFRPLPLYPVDETISKPAYPYTLRNIEDQLDLHNVQNTNGWLLNPPLDNDRYMNFNPMYREFRHGYSLPPKDRINAELQSSDMSIHDYFYLTETSVISPLFSNTTGVDLFEFASDPSLYALKCYLKICNPNVTVSTTDSNWYMNVADRYKVVPHHPLYTTGYDNTVFIDESFCTLNSPDVDYNFRQQVEPWFKDQLIETVGYAQITNSMSDIDIPDTQFEQNFEDSDLLDKDSLYNVTGKCLFNITNTPNNNLDADTQNFIKKLAVRAKLQNNPMSVFSGPWWLDTMLVNCFKRHIEFDASQSGAQLRFITGNTNYNSSVLADDITPWQLEADALYNLSTSSSYFNPNSSKCRWFSRGISFTKDEAVFHWTTSFHGETNKLVSRNHVLNSECSTYPYVETTNGPALFIEFLTGLWQALNPYNNNPYDLAEQLYNWAHYSLTWNTVHSTQTYADDVYWSEFFNNRQKLLTAKPPINAGTMTLPVTGIPNNSTTLGDVRSSIHEGDFRGTFSYYFFPYYGSNNATLSFYRNAVFVPNWHTEYIHIVHPWLLPQNRDFLTRHVNQTSWTVDSAGVVANLTTYSDYETEPTMVNIYNNGSKFGCHYYAPFSTNFCGGYLDPYYAHVVYPFMSSGIPFCGSSQAYRCSSEIIHPDYNATHSCLYSNCTNYVETNSSHKTYSAYYHSPSLTQELYAEPDLTSIPFVAQQPEISYLYSYMCNDNYVNLSHRTQTLTAAMKWYRGFRSLESASSTTDLKLITTGVYLNKANLAGNLLFSGYLPQFCTKSGLLDENDTYDNLNYRTVMDRLDDFKTFFDQGGTQIVELKFLSTPHIIYHNELNDNTLMLLDKFYVNDPVTNIILDVNETEFTPQFYYKEFINDPVPIQPTSPSGTTPYNVSNARNWYYNTYPHTGHFEEFHFDNLSQASQPYWNYGHTGNAVFGYYPENIAEPQHQVNLDDQLWITYDSNGKSRDKSNYWLLPISNMYNSTMISSYTAAQKNPYTYLNVSPEQWNWKMCGNTVNLNDLLVTNIYATRQAEVKYLEGDTYFQRYNCFKTVSKDTTFASLWEQQTSDETSGTNINDVTETASVMIESYYNIDGIYWDHNALTDENVSPLIHPYYNNQHQINPVYSIQNDICDVFRQIDTNYQSSGLEHYPTMIIWSVQKQDGETTDSWGIVPVTNKMLTSGEMGAINKLVSYRNNIYCLQEHGLSVLNYNAQVVEPTDTNSTLSVYLSDATRLQDVTYLSRNVGTLNKWSVVIGQRGFYWIDETLQDFYKCGESENSFGIENLSDKYGFKAWSKAHISRENCPWHINTFADNLNAFKANYDLNNGDVYWANGEWCICFNEQLDCFTSFYSYEKIPYKFNYLDKCYSINNTNVGSSIWRDYDNYTHKLYSQPYNAYVELLVNPIGQYDKVFNFIEYHTDAYPANNNFKYEMLNPYNRLSAFNAYQFGEHTFDKSNTKNRFNIWRSDLPREIKNNKQTMNRIRSPWCHIRLQFDPTQQHNFNTDGLQEYRDKLYYINVNYNMPEQPLKTNVKQE